MSSTGGYGYLDPWQIAYRQARDALVSAGLDLSQAYARRQIYHYAKKILAGQMDFKRKERKHSVDVSMADANRSQAVGVQSYSSDLPKLVLRDATRFLRKSRRKHAEARRLSVELGTTSFPLDLNRAVTFGSTTVIGDDLQGYCKWHTESLLPPSVLDQCVLRYFTDLYDATASANLDYITAKWRFRNQSSYKCEVDFYLFFPRADIPLGDRATSEGYFLGDNPQFIQDCYNVANMPQPPTGHGSAFFLNAPRLYNEYNANPFECPTLVDQWNVRYKGTRKFNPGDCLDVEFAIGNQLIFPQLQLVQPLTGSSTVAFSNQYAYMRRCGPLVVWKVRGDLIHAEAKENKGDSTQPNNAPGQSASPGSWTNYSGFNLEYVRTYNYAMHGLNSLYYIGANHGIFGNNPNTVNQTTLLNAQAWGHQLPQEAQGAV